MKRLWKMAKAAGAIVVIGTVGVLAYLIMGGQRRGQVKVQYVSRRTDGASTLAGAFGALLDVGRGAVSGGGSVSGSGVGARLMRDLRRDFGLTVNQAAGVVGNLSHESADFKTLQEIRPTVKGSRGGYGYAQWTGPRRRDFEGWVKARGLDPRSYAANYGFLKYELTSTNEARVIRSLKRTSTAAEAAYVFSGKSSSPGQYDGYLRPGVWGITSRKARAQKYAGGA